MIGRNRGGCGPFFQRAEESTMAEISKLSVGKVLDKLRSNDAPEKSGMTQLDDKIKAAEEEIQRLRAARLRVKRGQPAARRD
jgi:uncharacterized small protein (DUF1192 family)